MTREEAHLRNEAKFANLARAKESARLAAKWRNLDRVKANVEYRKAHPIPEPKTRSLPIGPALLLASRYVDGRPRSSSPLLT
jgi:hypothetical protein